MVISKNEKTLKYVNEYLEKFFKYKYCSLPAPEVFECGLNVLRYLNEAAPTLLPIIIPDPEIRNALIQDMNAVHHFNVNGYRTWIHVENLTILICFLGRAITHDKEGIFSCLRINHLPKKYGKKKTTTHMLYNDREEHQHIVRWNLNNKRNN